MQIHRRLALVALTSSLAACFGDFAIRDPKEAQLAAAGRAAPSQLKAAPPAGESDLPPSRAARPLTVRVHATPRYRAEVMDWQRQLDETIDGANRVLGPALGVKLRVVSAEADAPRVADDDLETVLGDLAARDPATDADLAVMLVGSVPRAELSFRQLGMARRMSKHLVMRAMNDAREYEAIEQNLPLLDEKERRALYRDRRHHKAATVMLHEIAHTLGVIHEADPRTIMAARYDPKIEGFSEAALGFMRLALDHRAATPPSGEARLFESLRDHLERTRDAWVAAERDEILPRLGAAASMRPRAPAPPPPPSAADLAPLKGNDLLLLDQAMADRRAGDLAGAWKRARPLWSKYPDVLAVQELRCQLAMAIGGAFAAVQAECQRLMELSGPSPKR